MSVWLCGLVVTVEGIKSLIWQFNSMQFSLRYLLVLRNICVLCLVQNNFPCIVSCTWAWKIKTSLRANLSGVNEFDLNENKPAGETHFHMNGFAGRLLLTQSQKITWKWPIRDTTWNKLNKILQLAHKLLRVSNDTSLNSWLFTQHGRRVKLRTPGN